MSNQYKQGTRVSEYVLEQQLGAGAFGEVWRGKHHIWNEQVAIKLPTEPEYVRYLRKEGMVVHGLRHPNIVGVKGLDPYADIPYLVMELVNGPSLRQVIDEHPSGLPLKATRVILEGILSGIAVAHDANILHRDLKPGNVLLDLDGQPIEQIRAGQVKVSDFGLGIGTTDTLRSIAQSASLDRDDRLVGTLAYMASELRDGACKADQRSDLYSVGVMLFELLTGERPAGAELPSTIRADAPTGYDDMFRKLYSRRDRRYESAHAVLADLAALDKPKHNPAKRTDRSAAPLPPIPVGSGAGNCDKCGARVESYDQFCTQCRRQLVETVSVCSSCGAYPGPRDKFCIFCGLKLGAN
jgi:serine/threonine protein kinase